MSEFNTIGVQDISITHQHVTHWHSLETCVLKHLQFNITFSSKTSHNVLLFLYKNKHCN